MLSSTAIDQWTEGLDDQTQSDKDSVISRSPSSVFDDVRRSPSVTSLSSADSDKKGDDLSNDKDAKSKDTSAPSEAMRDTWGTEFVEPDFTIKQIRDAIPAHCYERSELTSLYYIFRDLALLASTFYISYTYIRPEYVPSKALRFGLWTIYTLLQGLFSSGIFVIAHEAGHQALSPRKSFNDTVGYILDSAILVPYYSWKITHGKHHKATGHKDKDMNFCPVDRDLYASRMGKVAHEISEMTEEAPAVALIRLIMLTILGWPLYLATNASSNNNHDKQKEGKGKGKSNGNGVNHYYPSSPLFDKKDEFLVVLSDIGVFAALSILAFIGYKFGLGSVMVWYFIPWTQMNMWLVANTILQHTDASTPRYNQSSWTFVKGAATTVDRSNLGWVERHLFHSINETHVLHHYCSTIPHYHALEATEAIKKVMGRHYLPNPFPGGPLGYFKGVYTSSRACQWIEQDPNNQNVFWYRNRNGLGLPPATLEKMEKPAAKKNVPDTVGKNSWLNNVGLGMLVQSG